jgi:nucleotide-binding universal stress UspA family protein
MIIRRLIRKVYELQSQLSVEGLGVITKILVGVDGSENSEKALDYALEIAEKFSAVVQILNVFQPPPEIEYQLNMFQQTPASGYPGDQIGYHSNMAAFIRDLRKTHEAILSRAIERATKLKPALKITGEFKEGDASSQIVETAAKGQFDLIVLGHKGDSKITEFFLGSTSERVAPQAKCPVLIIK